MQIYTEVRAIEQFLVRVSTEDELNADSRTHYTMLSHTHTRAHLNTREDNCCTHWTKPSHTCTHAHTLEQTRAHALDDVVTPLNAIVAGVPSHVVLLSVKRAVRTDGTRATQE